MIIKKVALKNIKSYGEEAIEFREGITSIHGLNGAGKSTVLESIGYALFDSLPYKQDEFLRKGEKTGEVSITIIGKDDIEYTVTRKCGSTQYYSIRGQNGLLVEGKESVGPVLCDILGYKVPDISQLASLFENAVGVLQGTFVSEFLERPKERKQIFDPLLRIDEYNLAFENLRVLKSYVKDGIESVKQDIRFMEGKTAPLERLKDEKESLSGHISLLKDQFSINNGIFDRLSKDRSHLDEIQAEIRDLEGRQKVTSVQSINIKAEIDRLRAELKKSEDAKRKLEQNESSYKLYVEKVVEKEALEKQRGEKDELLRKVNIINPIVEGLKVKIADCDKDLKEMETYKSEILKLEPLAAVQEKIESEILRLQSDLNARGHELEQLKNRMKPLKTVKGSMCPILPDVECKNDLQGYFSKEIARVTGLKEKIEQQLSDNTSKLKDIKDPKLAISIKKDALKKQEQIKFDREQLHARLIEKESGQLELITSINRFSSLESQFKAVNGELLKLKPAYDEYQQNIRIAGSFAERAKDLNKAEEALQNKACELKAIEETLDIKKSTYDEKKHEEVKESCGRLVAEIATIKARIGSEVERLGIIENDLKAIEQLQKELLETKTRLSTEEDYLAFIDHSRDIIRLAAPEVIRVFIDLISQEATDMYCEIAGDRRFEVRWTQDYDILLVEEGRERTFRQLSGGEQMSAALAVRLAVLKILTSSDIVFLDEPTQNLDESRRERLAQEIMRIKDFKQMVIISHDDTFNASLENVIEIEKLNGESKVRRRNARPQATLS